MNVMNDGKINVWCIDYENEMQLDRIICEYQKLEKEARKKTSNLTFLHSESFKINTRKSKGNKSVQVDQPQWNVSSFGYNQNSSKHIKEASVSESEIILLRTKILHKKRQRKNIQHEEIQHKIYNTENTTRKIQHEKIQHKQIVLFCFTHTKMPSGWCSILFIQLA